MSDQAQIMALQSQLAQAEERIRVMTIEAGNTVAFLDHLRGMLNVSDRSFPAIERAVKALQDKARR